MLPLFLKLWPSQGVGGSLERVKRQLASGVLLDAFPGQGDPIPGSRRDVLLASRVQLQVEQPWVLEEA